MILLIFIPHTYSFSRIRFSKVVCKRNFDEVIYDILAGYLRQLLNARVLELLAANVQGFLLCVCFIDLIIAKVQLFYPNLHLQPIFHQG